VLTKENNEILTRVGKGTPSGDLLRRYWLPACLSSEIPEPDGPPVRVKLLGESLVAFRDTTGETGLVQEQCPHRGASLYFGRNEECGLRCVYHGWKFDRTGQCVDQRSERRSFADRIAIDAYPTHESGGIVWAYLGAKEAMTPFRDFGTESLAEEDWVVNKEYVECNWVQSFDGDLDTTHISNLHIFDAAGKIEDDGTDRPGYPSSYYSMRIWHDDPRARIEVNDEWYGFRYAGIRQTPKGHRHARITAYIFPLAAMIAAVPFSSRVIFHAPCDDYSVWRYWFRTVPPRFEPTIGGPAFFALPGYPYDMQLEGVVPRKYTLSNDYGIDRSAQKGVSYTGIPHFRSHDYMASETPGKIYDRTKEHLGSGDLAVTRFHYMVIAAAKALRDGKEPPVLAGAGDFTSIRAAEKILAEGEDWRRLGTNDDPMVREVYGLAEQPVVSGPTTNGGRSGEVQRRQWAE
jgi:phthalate 4,5-dioxygenase